MDGMFLTNFEVAGLVLTHPATFVFGGALFLTG
jgi:hypothetical protein